METSEERKTSPRSRARHRTSGFGGVVWLTPPALGCRFRWDPDIPSIGSEPCPWQGQWHRSETLGSKPQHCCAEVTGAGCHVIVDAQARTPLTKNIMMTINFTLGTKRSEMSSPASPPDESSASRQQSRLPRATRKGTRPDTGSHSENGSGIRGPPGNSELSVICGWVNFFFFLVCFYNKA